MTENYEKLENILNRALEQASRGKGKDRHADNNKFEDQPILVETRSVGIGFPAGQARKKILEATRCHIEHPERAIADLLGAINYIAAEIIYIEEKSIDIKSFGDYMEERTKKNSKPNSNNYIIGNGVTNTVRYKIEPLKVYDDD